MCGVLGIFGPFTATLDEFRLKGLVKNSIGRRGPDGIGVTVVSEMEYALGHSRLAINDLGDTGAQPMTSYCGRYILIFNGEIYNFKHLARQFDIDDDRSDSRVLIELISKIGLSESLKRLQGMFAFVLLDKFLKKVHAVRDSFGQKPLYFGSINLAGKKNLIISSTPKIFKILAGSTLEISEFSKKLFLHYGYIPSPYSIYDGVFKVDPGCLVEFDLKQSFNESTLKWFDHNDELLSRENNIHSGDSPKNFSSLLESVTSELLEADVDVGLFLSGGIDSSCIALAASRVSKNRIKTFSVGFENDYYDESRFATEYAAKLDLEHNNLIVTGNIVSSEIDAILDCYDEPFADSSQIPTALLSKFARKEIKTVLSGDGGDEMFGGYNRHWLAPRITRTRRFLPQKLSQLVARLINKLSDTQLNKLGALLNVSRPIHKFRKVAYLLDQENSNLEIALYDLLLSAEDGVGKTTNAGAHCRNFFETLLNGMCKDVDSREVFMWFDLMFYLHNDVLCKVDRASMGFGLEVRSPFLDVRIGKYAWRQSIESKFLSSEGKQHLRDYLRSGPESAALGIQKAGFSFPLGHCLQTDLKEWVVSVLEKCHCDTDEIRNLRELWIRHCKHDRDLSNVIWPQLVFQHWKARDDAYSLDF